MRHHLIPREARSRASPQPVTTMNINAIRNAIDFSGVADELGQGQYSVFAPSKDMGDPMDVHVLPGRFSTVDLAELVWIATLGDDEIEGLCSVEALAIDGRYETLAGTIVA